MPIVNATDCATLQSDIDKILNWTTANLMSFNSSKCKHMIISRKKSHLVAPAYLGGQVLEVGTSKSLQVSRFSFIDRSIVVLPHPMYLQQSQKNHGYSLLPAVLMQVDSNVGSLAIITLKLYR